jgi:hypothetical protein
MAYFDINTNAFHGFHAFHGLHAFHAFHALLLLLSISLFNLKLNQGTSACLSKCIIMAMMAMINEP